MNKKLILFVILNIIFYACSHKIFTNKATVNFISSETEGTITVRSTGIGKNLNYAYSNAETNAFNVILFRGIPDTEVKMPLIEDETKLTSQNSTFFDDFFSKGTYLTFIMSSVQSSKVYKVKHGVSVDVDLKINLYSFRRYLEQNQVIRKFGY